jgi:DNA-binding transcriptional MerR regulator
MKIKQLSTATGVDIETIRFYEREGLLPSPARSENGYRQYSQPHLERLAFVRHCRALDMPLAGIKRLLSLVDAPSSSAGNEADALVDEQLARVRARLKSMRALEKQLVQLRARCQGHAHGVGTAETPEHDASACGILQELVAAAHGEACVCHPN